MTNTTKTQATAILAALVLLPGLLAACSNTSGSNDATGTARSGGGSGAKLASCMRDKGYDMADPKSGADTLSAPDGVDQVQWSSDFSECSGTTSSGAGESFQGGQKLPDSAARGVAACLREAGFEDFPDGGPEQEQYLIARQDDPALMTASDDCYGKAWEQQGLGPKQ